MIVIGRGTHTISAIKVGTVTVTRIYLGSNIIYGS